MMSMSKRNYPNRLYNSAKIKDLIKSRWEEVWEVVVNRQNPQEMRSNI